MKKRLSLLMVLMMVLSLVPMSVFATAGTASGGLFSVDDTDEYVNKDVTVKLTQATGVKFTTNAQAILSISKGKFGELTKDASGKLTVEPDAFVTNVTFKGQPIGKVQRLDGAKEKAYLTIGTLADDTKLTQAQLEAILKADTIKDGVLIDDADLLVNLKVYFKDRASAGDVTLSVEEVNDSKIDVAKPIVVGTVKEGTGDDMKVTVKDAETKIGFDGGELSQITIKDIDKHMNADKIELELPDTLQWTAATKVIVGDTTLPAGAISLSASGNGKYKNVLTFSITDHKKQVIVKPDVTVDKRDTSKGEVSLKVRAMQGTKKLETVTATIGKIADFDVAMTAWEKGKKEIPAMYGGDDATIKVKMSGVKGSFTKNRVIDFTVKGAEVVVENSGKDIKVEPGKNFDKTIGVTGWKEDGETKVKDGEFSLTVGADNEDELEFELKIKADWAQKGAVTLQADSRDFGKIEAEIAKVTPAYTVETKVTSIKKGESLATADIVIKEAKAGLLDTDKFIVLNLNDKNRDTMSFAKGYKVESTNGMKLEDELFDETAGTRRGLNTLVLQVKTSSSKEAATITLSNVMVNVDGATVDGEKILASNIVEKDDLKASSKKDREEAVRYVFDADRTYKKTQDADLETPYVNVVKEYGSVATTTVFKIGSKEYTVNGEAKTANEAPFVSGKGYTMLPVKAVADALGLKADWNAATKTATFSNSSKVATVVIGADTMYVNGTPFKLAAKAEIKNGSTFVELRSLASAFLVELAWDASTKSVTIKG